MAILSLAGALGCNGEATGAVAAGASDAFDEFPSVVRFWTPTGGQCSGTLVTPFHVLTANHCITGSVVAVGPDELCSEAGSCTANASADASVDFVKYNGSSEASLWTVTNITHTWRSPADEIATAADSSCPTNLCPASWGDQARRDLAIVRLDQRVPTATFAPLHVPLSGSAAELSPPCYSGSGAFTPTFTAALVGFGRRLRVGSSTSRERNSSTSPDWKPDDGLVWNSWLTAGDAYEGSLDGDSGGPLIRESNGRLCGVISRQYLSPVVLAPIFVSDTVDLQTASNQAFLQAHLLDASKTHFIGECRPEELDGKDPRLADTDADCDGWPDACDPCPFLAETEPFAQDADDDDDDGIPDRCDPCPYVKTPYVEGTFNVPAPAFPGACVPRATTPTFAPVPDLDADGEGDACELCPADPTAGGKNDDDGDGVGDGCDDCRAGTRNSYNGYRACMQDADCTLTTLTGTVQAKCINQGRRGLCDLDGVTPCSDEIRCPTVYDLPQRCEGLSPVLHTWGWGHCSVQLDDPDEDGLGSVCDG